MASSAEATATGQGRLKSRAGINPDRVFERATWFIALGAIVTLLGIILVLFLDARPSIARYGLGFFATTTWDPVFEVFGAAAFIFGTLVTSFLGLLFATPVAVGSALFLVEYAGPRLRAPIAFLVEMLAAIPSIIYGLWAFFVLAPIMRGAVEPFLRDTFGEIPVIGMLFQGTPIGKDLLTAGLILAIMIVPTIMAIAREVLATVPDTQREGMIALGATRWETIRGAVLPYARSGIIGAAMLGLARALGETMAVTMVIGNSSTEVKPSLFLPGYTLASAIANQFTEADTEIYFSAVVQLALVLLIVATVINILARLLVRRFAGGPADTRAA